eukprot:CAMPEP_0170488014 /NCGR_PEP_ID=MMETSP0208-20121228/6665_1 /TAXON_ID=197538 /ORGANISM="Strombidium inclinatum, Strain S3" /LENGTH=152 /DNA_ID=CAMNT_0010762447 /DNA_START=1675 /DNA_END=2133 /DNA_ORIENTATION=-
MEKLVIKAVAGDDANEIDEEMTMKNLEVENGSSFEIKGQISNILHEHILQRLQYRQTVKKEIRFKIIIFTTDINGEPYIAIDMSCEMEPLLVKVQHYLSEELDVPVDAFALFPFDEEEEKKEFSEIVNPETMCKALVPLENSTVITRDIVYG